MASVSLLSWELLFRGSQKQSYRIAGVGTKSTPIIFASSSKLRYLQRLFTKQEGPGFFDQLLSEGQVGCPAWPSPSFLMPVVPCMAGSTSTSSPFSTLGCQTSHPELKPFPPRRCSPSPRSNLSPQSHRHSHFNQNHRPRERGASVSRMYSPI